MIDPLSADLCQRLVAAEMNLGLAVAGESRLHEPGRARLTAQVGAMSRRIAAAISLSAVHGARRDNRTGYQDRKPEPVLGSLARQARLEADRGKAEGWAHP